MTLLLPVNGPSLTLQERQALMTRKASVMIVPIGDIDFSWLGTYSCNLHLLLEGVLQLTLRGTSDVEVLLEAVAQSSTRPDAFRSWLNSGLNRRSAPMQYASKIFDRLNEAWRLSRFSDPTVSIYEAHLQRFVGDAIAIEVMYRDLPTRL